VKQIENEPSHRTLIRTLEQYHETVQAAANGYNPSLVANYSYELAKQFNHFYHEFSILKEEENKQLAAFRLGTGNVKLAKRFRMCNGFAWY
jgi:arginyl-tRNA synthetase